jgi:hypothetical protein
MKKTILLGIVMVLCVAWCAESWSQPLEGKEPIYAIGRICKTMESHPAGAIYKILDYATCGIGGVRLYPIPQLEKEFKKIPAGVQGEKPGKEVVLMHGRMRTKVMPEFSTDMVPMGHPRFRFSWLEVDRLKRNVKFSDKPKVTRKGSKVHISVNLTNPLDRPISGTELTLNLKGSQYMQPFSKMAPTIGPGKTEKVTIEIPDRGKVHGTLTIMNKSATYIDIQEKI